MKTIHRISKTEAHNNNKLNKFIGGLVNHNNDHSRNNSSDKKTILFPKPNKNSKCVCTWSPKAIGSGGERRAYPGVINYNSKRGKSGTKIVVKKFKNKRVFNDDEWDLQIKCHDFGIFYQCIYIHTL